MARPPINHYMRAAFEPIAAAAGRLDLLHLLKTADLAPGRKAAQFKRLKLARPDPEEALYLPASGFVARYRHDAGLMICVSAPALDESQEAELDSWAANRGLLREDIDESTFLFLRLYFGAYYIPRRQYLSRDEALNQLFISTQPGYAGHQIHDMIPWYQPVYLYNIPVDAVYQDKRLYFVAAELCSTVPALQSAILSNNLSDRLRSLCQLDNVNPENLFFAASSGQWKHVFLDLYGCLEALFYLPWALALKRTMPFSGAAADLAKICKNDLKWRAKEKDSIRMLFGLTDDAVIRDPLLKAVGGFNDLEIDTATLESFGERVYSYRNQVVHQEDYERASPIQVAQPEWEKLCTYLCNIIEYLYFTYRTEVSLSFPRSA